MREIATLLCVFGMAGLFWLAREPNVKVSRALWIPVVYLLINGSRPVSLWLGIAPTGGGDSVYLEGSPIDRAVWIVLLVAGLAVLIGRREEVGTLLRRHGPILLFFSFAAFSAFWSEFPLVTLKHWVKGIEDVVMVLIILTEAEPNAALRRFFARTAFVLIPLSLLFSKYYPEFGRWYSHGWVLEYTGVTLNKNELGMICLVFGLGSLWCFISAWGDKENLRRKQMLIAHGAVLGIVIWLFCMINSMTSTSCIVLASVAMLLVNWSWVRRSAAKMHAVVIVVVGLTLIALFFDPGGGLVGELGRNPTLTGRTEIWHDVLSIAQQPVAGAGYESFWLGSHLQVLRQETGFDINEAHNGYIEIYLSLGWIGIALLAGIFAMGYQKVIAALRANQKTATLSLGMFLACALYSLTEAGLRMQTPTWIFFLLAVMLASRVGSSETTSELGLGGAGSVNELEPAAR